MVRITLQGIRKSYGPVPVVHDLSLEIEPGSLFFLLGGSGCGKTTILRMIAGFIEPTAGRILFDGQDVTALPAEERQCGMVFQSYALWPHMTVRDNVAFGLDVRGVKGQERARRVDEALAMVRMDQYADRKPNQLSGGQQQRVALARAIVFRPRVLLLDEPLSNLDAKLRLEMRHEIRRICRELGITTVYVTHDQDEALSLADHVVVMRDGRIVQQGSPRELYERPATRFLAEFLGETNFIPATIERSADGSAVLSTPLGMLSSAHVGERAAGTQVLLSVRTEAWTIDADGPVALPCIQSTYLGKLAQHELDARGLRLRVTELNPPVADRAGQTVRLSVDPMQVIVLDGA